MTREQLATDGAPAIAWTTIARAERLAHAGLGWTPDQVLRRALDLLEQRHLQPDPEPTGRVFTRDELVAAMARDDLHLDPGRSAADERYLLALAEAFDPDPYGERV